EDLSSNGTLIRPDFLLRGGRQELEYGSSITVGPFDITVGQAAGPGARTARAAGPSRAAAAVPLAAPTRRGSTSAPAIPPAAPTGRAVGVTSPPPAAANVPVPVASAPAIAEAVSPTRN